MPDENSQVFLLHGLGRTRCSMARLARRLTRAGYAVSNLAYPSRHQPIEQIAAGLHATIAGDRDTPIHFVGFSLGCLVIRAYLHAYPETQTGRVVMIGPPNQGSELADALHRRWYYRYLLGPAGQQLRTGLSGGNGAFGEIRGEVGIIAGSRSLEPWTRRYFDGPNDGKVSVERTKLDGMADHLLLPVTHSFLPTNHQVHRQVEAFLRHGYFERP